MGFSVKWYFFSHNHLVTCFHAHFDELLILVHFCEEAHDFPKKRLFFLVSTNRFTLFKEWIEKIGNGKSIYKKHSIRVRNDQHFKYIKTLK